jgi:hypothetical protein
VTAYSSYAASASRALWMSSNEEAGRTRTDWVENPTVKVNHASVNLLHSFNLKERH